MKCRLISLFLVITMIFGMFPQTLSIYAEEMQTSKGIQEETSVEETVLPSETVTSQGGLILFGSNQGEPILFGSNKSSPGTKPTINTIYNRVDHYLLDTNIDSDAKLLSLAVDSGYFKLPTSLSDGSENGVTFEAGVLLTTDGEKLATTTDSLIGVSFKIDTSVAGYKSVFNGIKYYPSNSTAPQKLKCTTSNLELEPGDKYFGGHVYRYVPSSALGNSLGDSKNIFRALDYVYTTGSAFYTELGTPYLATSTRKAENDFLVNLTSGKDYAFMGGLAHYKDEGQTQKFTASELNVYNDFSDFTKYTTTASLVASVNAQQFYWMDGATNEVGMNVNSTEFNVWHNSHPVSLIGGIEIGWGGPYWSDDGAYHTKAAIVEWGRTPLGEDNSVSISSNPLSVTLSEQSFKYYVKSTGDDTSGNGTATNPYKTIQHAMAQIKALPQTITGDAVIYVMDNITMNETIDLDFARNVMIATTNVNQDGSIHPASSPVTATRATSFATAALFKINSSGCNLNIQNIAINGGDIAVAETAGTSGFILEKGNLTLDNASVTNHKNINPGGEIFYTYEDSILTIRNSKIESNSSIYETIDAHGNLRIDTGCTISNNRAKRIIAAYGTETVLNNPTITSNTIGTDGYVMFFYGKGTVTINGANISGNKNVIAVVMLYTSKTLILNGTTNPISISDNNDVSVYAVDINNTAFADTGDLKISGNVNITGNGSTGKKNVYLPNNEVIKLTASITGSNIGVTVQTPPAKAEEKVKIAEKDETTGYTPIASDENIFMDDGVDSSNRIVKTLTDGIYLIFKYDVATPVISTQPISGSQVENTSNHTLSVSATASDNPPGKLSYQWYSNITNTNVGGTPVVGGVNTTFNPPNNVVGDVYYYCEVTNTNNEAGAIKTKSVKSNATKVITVKLVNVVTPTITKQPVDGSQLAGSTVPITLSITATASDNPPGTLSYQWYSNTTDSNVGGTLIGGATSSTYVVPNTTPSNLYYYCVVKNTNNTVNGTKAVIKASDAANVIIKIANIVVKPTDPIEVTIPGTDDGLVYNIVEYGTTTTIGDWKRGTEGNLLIKDADVLPGKDYDIVVGEWNGNTTTPGLKTGSLAKVIGTFVTEVKADMLTIDQTTVSIKGYDNTQAYKIVGADGTTVVKAWTRTAATPTAFTGLTANTQYKVIVGTWNPAFNSGAGGVNPTEPVSGAFSFITKINTTTTPIVVKPTDPIEVVIPATDNGLVYNIVEHGTTTTITDWKRGTEGDLSIKDADVLPGKDYDIVVGEWNGNTTTPGLKSGSGTNIIGTFVTEVKADMLNIDQTIVSIKGYDNTQAYKIVGADGTTVVNAWTRTSAVPTAFTGLTANTQYKVIVGTWNPEFNSGAGGVNPTEPVSGPFSFITKINTTTTPIVVKPTDPAKPTEPIEVVIPATYNGLVYNIVEHGTTATITDWKRGTEGDLSIKDADVLPGKNYDIIVGEWNGNTTAPDLKSGSVTNIIGAFVTEVKADMLTIDQTTVSIKGYDNTQAYKIVGADGTTVVKAWTRTGATPTALTGLTANTQYKVIVGTWNPAFNSGAGGVNPTEPVSGAFSFITKINTTTTPIVVKPTDPAKPTEPIEVVIPATDNGLVYNIVEHGTTITITDWKRGTEGDLSIKDADVLPGKDYDIITGEWNGNTTTPGLKSGSATNIIGAFVTEVKADMLTIDQTIVSIKGYDNTQAYKIVGADGTTVVNAWTRTSAVPTAFTGLTANTQYKVIVGTWNPEFNSGAGGVNPTEPVSGPFSFITKINTTTTPIVVKPTDPAKPTEPIEVVIPATYNGLVYNIVEHGTTATITDWKRGTEGDLSIKDADVLPGKNYDIIVGEWNGNTTAPDLKSGSVTNIIGAFVTEVKADMLTIDQTTVSIKGYDNTQAYKIVGVDGTTVVKAWTRTGAAPTALTGLTANTQYKVIVGTWNPAFNSGAGGVNPTEPVSGAFSFITKINTTTTPIVVKPTDPAKPTEPIEVVIPATDNGLVYNIVEHGTTITITDWKRGTEGDLSIKDADVLPGKDYDIITGEWNGNTTTPGLKSGSATNIIGAFVTEVKADMLTIDQTTVSIKGYDNTQAYKIVGVDGTTVVKDWTRTSTAPTAFTGLTANTQYKVIVGTWNPAFNSGAGGVNPTEPVSGPFSFITKINTITTPIVVKPTDPAKPTDPIEVVIPATDNGLVYNIVEHGTTTTITDWKRGTEGDLSIKDADVLPGKDYDIIVGEWNGNTTTPGLKSGTGTNVIGTFVTEVKADMLTIDQTTVSIKGYDNTQAYKIVGADGTTVVKAWTRTSAVLTAFTGLTANTQYKVIVGTWNPGFNSGAGGVNPTEPVSGPFSFITKINTTTTPIVVKPTDPAKPTDPIEVVIPATYNGLVYNIVEHGTTTTITDWKRGTEGDLSIKDADVLPGKDYDIITGEWNGNTTTPDLKLGSVTNIIGAFVTEVKSDMLTIDQTTVSIKVYDNTQAYKIVGADGTTVVKAWTSTSVAPTAFTGLTANTQYKVIVGTWNPASNSGAGGVNPTEPVSRPFSFITKINTTTTPIVVKPTDPAKPTDPIEVVIPATDNGLVYNIVEHGTTTTITDWKRGTEGDLSIKDADVLPGKDYDIITGEWNGNTTTPGLKSGSGTNIIGTFVTEVKADMLTIDQTTVSIKGYDNTQAYKIVGADGTTVIKVWTRTGATPTAFTGLTANTQYKVIVGTWNPEFNSGAGGVNPTEPVSGPFSFITKINTTTTPIVVKPTDPGDRTDPTKPIEPIEVVIPATDNGLGYNMVEHGTTTIITDWKRGIEGELSIKDADVLPGKDYDIITGEWNGNTTTPGLKSGTGTNIIGTFVTEVKAGMLTIDQTTVSIKGYDNTQAYKIVGADGTTVIKAWTRTGTTPTAFTGLTANTQYKVIVGTWNPGFNSGAGGVNPTEPVSGPFSFITKINTTTTPIVVKPTDPAKPTDPIEVVIPATDNGLVYNIVEHGTTTTITDWKRGTEGELSIKDADVLPGKDYDIITGEWNGNTTTPGLKSGTGTNIIGTFVTEVKAGMLTIDQTTVSIKGYDNTQAYKIVGADGTTVIKAWTRTGATPTVFTGLTANTQYKVIVGTWNPAFNSGAGGVNPTEPVSGPFSFITKINTTTTPIVVKPTDPIEVVIPATDNGLVYNIVEHGTTTTITDWKRGTEGDLSIKDADVLPGKDYDIITGEWNGNTTTPGLKSGSATNIIGTFVTEVKADMLTIDQTTVSIKGYDNTQAYKIVGADGTTVVKVWTRTGAVPTAFTGLTANTQYKVMVGTWNPAFNSGAGGVNPTEPVSGSFSFITKITGVDNNNKPAPSHNPILRPTQGSTGTQGPTGTQKLTGTEGQDLSLFKKSGVSNSLNTTNRFAYLVGYGGKFRPDDSITRAETAQMFYNLLLDKSVKEGSAKEFDDIYSDEWYYNAVTMLSSQGIINGYPDGSFKPNEPITRAEFVRIACGFANEVEGTKTFVDVANSHWASDEIKMAVYYEWIVGYPDGTFKPEKDITRAEATVIVNNMINRQPDNSMIDANDINKFTDVSKNHWAYYEIMEACYTYDSKIVDGKDGLTNAQRKF